MDWYFFFKILSQTGFVFKNERIVTPEKLFHACLGLLNFGLCLRKLCWLEFGLVTHNLQPTLWLYYTVAKRKA